MNFDKIIYLKQAAQQLSYRLPLYKQQSFAPFRGNFRCDICGDSQKNRFKRRGFILEESGTLFKYCHNCGYSAPLEVYLRDHHPDLYQHFKFEMLASSSTEQVVEERPIGQFMIVSDYQALNGLTDIIKLPKKHPAVQYVLTRKLPVEEGRFYYTDRFYAYINQILPNKFSEGALKRDHPRLVLPLRREDGTIFGAIGRDISLNSDLRYLTIKFDDSAPKIYGLERLDRSRHAKIVEGPIDSLFLDNCIALAGTDGKPADVFERRDQYTLILDNQPRNRDVLNKYARYISAGHQIVIWPKFLKEKDINDLVIAGMSTIEIEEIIRDNTFVGLEAEIKFKYWKKSR